MTHTEADMIVNRFNYHIDHHHIDHHQGIIYNILNLLTFILGEITHLSLQ